ncbi:MAG: M3 family oligoendopeptidase [Treponemataceae bacterium]|nr:M3 family oligoendopeptidase [Treponemataceae bacterium]
MKFSEMPYKRPDFEACKTELRSKIEAFKNAENAEEQIRCIDEINVLHNHIETQAELSNIRHSINNKDEFYEKENDYWDEYGPLYENESQALAKTILASPFLEELKKKYPEQYFSILEMDIKSFDQCVIEDMQEENKLASKYNRIRATAQIDFDGKTYTLPKLAVFLEDPDRSVRKRAAKAICDFYGSHEQEIDEIYDKLVKVRDKIAKKLGFKNFVELGYVRMKRSDYNASDVAGYRRQILDIVTPMAQELVEEQRKRLGYETIYDYDLDYKFASGTPKPQGSPEWIVEKGRKMYSELSPETDEFFTMMADNELLDLVSKDGKEGGGYTTFITDYKSPFIFSNFNGTSGDIEVLTHEAGHAFQVYCSRNITLPECIWPTYESCEIHSMSMEFFTYPWMKNFFGKDTDKFYYDHLAGTVRFLPYGVLVDHFQHEVYEHPEMTPAERKATWRMLEKMYMPWKKYDDEDLYERGGWWFKQLHIFNSPFYYIDYTLAQVCAQQFFGKMNKDFKEAWKDYLHLCQLGGTQSFLGLVKEAKLKNPFEEGTVAATMGVVKEKLAEFAKGDIL